MIYREDDWEAEVEVLENNSNDEWFKYKLKVIRTLRETGRYIPTSDGHIFSVSKRKRIDNFGFYMWSLDSI